MAQTKEQIRKYKRDWRKANRDKVNNARKKYYLKDPEKWKKYHREWQKEHYHKDIKKSREEAKEWFKNNKEKHKGYRKKYMKKMKEERPEKYKEYLAKERVRSEIDRKNNPEKYRKRAMKNYWKKNGERKRVVNGDGWDTMRLRVLARDDCICRRCGMGANEVHHLDESGSNRPEKMKNNKLENLITVCHKCHLKIHDPDNNGFGKGKWEEETIRNKKIFELSETISQTKISKMYGITRQRVHQIINNFAEKEAGIK